jgi:hypothetical protein
VKTNRTVGTLQHVPLPVVYQLSSQHSPPSSSSVVRNSPPQQLPVPGNLHSPSQQNPVGRAYSSPQQLQPVHFAQQHKLHAEPSITPIGYIAAA